MSNNVTVKIKQCHILHNAFLCLRLKNRKRLIEILKISNHVFVLMEKRTTAAKQTAVKLYT